jgi:hypothetical protein
LSRTRALLSVLALTAPLLAVAAAPASAASHVAKRAAATVQLLRGTTPAGAFAPRAIRAPSASVVTPRSTWQVTYTGFTATQQASFQAAVDIWAGIVQSSVPIKVTATLQPLGAGILGSAGPGGLYSDSTIGDGFSYYPAALASSLLGQDVDTLSPDIEALFASTQPNIYYGTDGNPPANAIDFETVVLHELGHGLGFVGSADVIGANGTYDGFVFDLFNTTSAGVPLVTIPNGAALKTAFTNNQVYWGGAYARAANGGARPRLYAPNPWEGGSSISHLDETVYGTGTVNSLMTPVLSNQEVVHDPGPLTRGIFRDMGWQVFPVVPNGPSGVTAIAGDSSAAVSWTAPSDNGSAITGYLVTASPGGATTLASSSPAVVTGLANGTAYTFTVQAINAIGTGLASAVSSPVTPAPPAGPDTTAPTVTITSGPGAFSPLTAGSIAFSGSDPGRPAALLTYACTLDGLVTDPCTSPLSYSGFTNTTAHTFSVQARDEAPNTSSAATRSWTVDTTTPTIAAAATPLFTLGSTVGLSTTATDSGSGVTSRDFRYRRAAWNGGFSALIAPSAWQGTTASAVALATTKGFTYCLSARSRDAAGNVSPWSAERCTATPLDDRSLAATAGWGRVAGGAYYAGTATTAARTGVVLTRTSVQVRHLAIVATSCRGCGVVGVYLNGRLVRTLSLNSATTMHRRVLTVADFQGIAGGTITIRTLNAGRVFIDGLALSRT